MRKILAVVWLSYFVVSKLRSDAKKQTQVQAMASKAAIFIVLMLYPGLSTKIFLMFKCKTIDGVDGRFLVADYNQRCYDDEHASYMLLGIVMLCVYVLGIPASMFVLLWKNKKHL